MTNIAPKNDSYQILLRPQCWNLAGTGDVHDVLPTKDIPPSRVQWSVDNESSHNHHEFLFCLRGEAFFGLAGKYYYIRPGTLIAVRPRAGHDDHYPPVPGELEHIWFHLLTDSVAIGWCRIEDGRTQRLEQYSRMLENEDIGVNVHQQIEQAQSLAPELYAARIRWVLGAVAERLYTRVQQVRSGEITDQPSLQESVIASVRKYIEHSTGCGVTLDGLSHFTGYSKFHLSRMFRKHMGCTIHAYIDKIRLTRLKEMRRKSCSNREIADTFGFSCPTALLRWQRQMKKISPDSF